jgi:hypothetical protein
MFNLRQSIQKLNFYNFQYAIISQLILESLAIITLLEITRSQISEIKLLQLIPGYYFFLLFLFLTLSYLFNLLFNFYPNKLDQEKVFGTKSISRQFVFSFSKFLYFFYFLAFFFCLNSIVPLSLDSFYFYSEKTLENIWSFNDLITLESFLLFLIFFISEFPLILLSQLKIEKNVINFPKYFKYIFFSIFVFSGVLTPTLDASSQIFFSAFSLISYLLSIYFSLKRLKTKYLSLSSLD